jgi:YVTN family beta-propeller protein
MKKQIHSTVKAHLVRSAFYALLLLGMCVILFALAQRHSRNPVATPRATVNSASSEMPETAHSSQSLREDTAVAASTESGMASDRMDIGDSVAGEAPIPRTQSPAVVAYVPNFNSNTVSVIDTANNNAVVATVPVRNGPLGVAVKPDGTRAYVTNAFSNNLSVIDTSNDTVVATVPVGSTPQGVAVKPDGTRGYVVNDAATMFRCSTSPLIPLHW